MKKTIIGKPILVFAVFLLPLLLTILLNPKTTTAQEVEKQIEFDYIEGSDKGPDKWGDLHEEWAFCKNGSLQSPIDLVHEKVDVDLDLGRIYRNYQPSTATLKNRGHDITVEWEIGSAGSVEINSINYELQQCHWHSPSEHRINGKSFALELHMVHRNLELNQIAVIGVLYNIGLPDRFLSKIEDDISAIAKSDKELNIGMINPKIIHRYSSEYYRYLGSLTTPPCSEGVIWTINKKVMSVSLKQVKLLRDAVHDGAENNARPLQLLNDREIFFRPFFSHSDI